MKPDTIINLDPSKVLAEDNIRYSLLGHRVDALAESIVAQGGVKSPVEVVKLSPPNNGYTHQLLTGFYRHAAVEKLNKESKAGLPLPAIVRDGVEGVERLKRQASENLDRENLSPMDIAHTIKRLLDAEVSKGDIRKMFQRPGGRKGVQMQPASNSFVNMHLSFLELPKAIQTKIHDGRIGTSAAYELTRVPAEAREGVLEKAETARLRAIDREEKEEAREAKGAEKEGAQQAKLDAAKAALDTADAEMAEATAKRDAAMQAEKDARRTPENYLDLPDADKKAIAEKVGAAKAEVKAAVKVLKDATNKQGKAAQAYRKLTDSPAEEVEPVAKPVREGKAGKQKGAAVGPQDVRKAAKEAGVSTAKPVQLTASECREAAAELAKSRFPKVKAIGAIISKMLAGELTPKSAETDLTVLTGERKTHKA